MSPCSGASSGVACTSRTTLVMPLSPDPKANLTFMDYSHNLKGHIINTSETIVCRRCGLSGEREAQKKKSRAAPERGEDGHLHIKPDAKEASPLVSMGFAPNVHKL